jgi:hypothetical protein
VPPPPGPAATDTLAFLVQPSNVNVSQIMEPLVQIEVLAPDGQVDTSSQAAITVHGVDTNGFAIEGGGGDLVAVNGIATMTSLVVLTPGLAHVLVATSSFGSVTSQPFDAVLPGAGSPSSAPWQLLTGLTAPPMLPFSFAIDPASPQTVYALGTFGPPSSGNVPFGPGISKSVDGGATWQSASLGLTDSDVQSLVIDPVNDQTLYCTTYSGGVFKSTDGAASWTWSSDGTGASVIGQVSFVFAVDPKNDQVVYGSETGIGFNKTTNGGAHWSHSAGFLDDVTSLALSPANHLLLYAVTSNGPGTAMSSDGGATWNAVAPLASPVSCYALDPVSSSVVYAGTSGAGVFKSTDGGRSFATASSGMGLQNVTALSISPGNPSTLYAQTTKGGAFVSQDGGSSWSPLLAGASSSEPISVLAMNPANGLDLIAGTTSGIWRSADGGSTWTSKSAGVVTGAFVVAAAVAPSDPNTLYAAIGNALDSGPFVPYANIMMSSDAGVTWTDVTNGIINASPQSEPYAIAIDPVTASTVYLGSQNGLAVTTNAGASWTALSPGGAVTSVVIDPSTTSTIYAVVYGSGASLLRKSTDGGATWSDADTGLPFGNVQEIAIDPVHPATLFACAETLFRSTDGATTFTGLGLQATGSVSVDPLNDANVWAAAADLTSTDQIYVSRDGGSTLSIVPTGYDGMVGDPQPDPLNEGTVYGASPLGAFKTTDGGTSWALARNGMWAGFPGLLVFDPVHAGTVYAPTSVGLFKTTTGGQ